MVFGEKVVLDRKKLEAAPCDVLNHLYKALKYFDEKAAEQILEVMLKKGCTIE